MKICIEDMLDLFCREILDECVIGILKKYASFVIAIVTDLMEIVMTTVVAALTPVWRFFPN